MLFYCTECGGAFRLDADAGTSHHVTAGGTPDFDTDADHVAYGEELVKPVSLIDRLRKDLHTAGIPFEHIATAVGLTCEYATTAYAQGYTRGFAQGVEWQEQKALRLANRAQREGTES